MRSLRAIAGSCLRRGVACAIPCQCLWTPTRWTVTHWKEKSINRREPTATQPPFGLPSPYQPLKFPVLAQGPMLPKIQTLYHIEAWRGFASTLLVRGGTNNTSICSVGCYVWAKMFRRDECPGGASGPGETPDAVGDEQITQGTSHLHPQAHLNHKILPFLGGRGSSTSVHLV